jgi:hypothetical protein
MNLVSHGILGGTILSSGKAAVRASTWLARVFRGRKGFLALVVIGIGLKLLVSMFLPVTQDQSDMFLMASGMLQPGEPHGPWIFLEAQMINAWGWLTGTAPPASWWKAPALSTPIQVKLLALFLRLPALAFDVATAIALYFTVKKYSSPRNARYASLLWFLNPYTLVAVDLLAVPDVAATFMLVLATLLLPYKRTLLSAASVAIGVAVKLFPLLLLPAFLILPSVRGRGWRYQLFWTFMALLGFVGYFAWALVGDTGPPIDYSPIEQPLNAIFTALPATKTSVTVVSLVILYFWMYEFAKGKNLIISDLTLPVLLVYFTFTDPYPQYFAWALPFLILDVVLVERRHLKLLAVLIIILFGNWFYFSHGFITPSGYSLLLIPLQGSNLPWYSGAINYILKSSNLAYTVLNASLYATTFIYALEIIRGWSKVRPTEMRRAQEHPL